MRCSRSTPGRDGMIIMGVDPGLNATGYGIIDAARVGLRVITAIEK